MKKVVLIITFLIASISMVAQSFPVQLIPQAVPPQSVYISDYANGFTTSDRLRLQILLTDLTVLNREVRLKVYLEGEGIFAESRDFVIGSSNIFIDGGVPIQLGSADLAPYFEFQNLQNINQNIYASALPEGIYQFCFEIYDVLSGNRLSQKTCASSILFQNAPPFLTAPLNESVFEYQDIYNILFQWTPRHINVTNVQYEMTLVQIYDNYVDPQAAFLSSTPIFQQVTNTTTLLYDQSFPPLIPGYKYAWRVRAFASNGADEISVFDNQGFSEIWSFTYIEACDAPLTLAEETIGIDHAQITWQGSQSHLDYKISYREKNANSSWYVRNTPREYITINGLKPATSYQYKVAGNCDLGSFEYSPIKEFTTLANVQDSPNYVCDIPPGTIDLSNQTLLPELLINDLFFANDFPITVLELTSATAPFTGKGYIGIPWLNFARIGVQFNGIQINDDFKMVAGFVETTYDADWSNVNFIDEYTDFLEGDNDIVEVELDFDVDTIVIINGEVIITGTNGVVVTYPNTDDLVITDTDGTTYVIPANSDDTPEGTSIDPVTTAEGGSIDTASTPGFTNGVLTQLSTEDVKVTFSEASNGIYSFDKIQENYREELDAKYENIKDIDGTNYDVVYKAIEKSKTDEIIANITTNDVSKLDNLVFKTKNGILIPHTLSTDKSTATLTVKGLFGYESVDVFATIVKPQDSTETIAGVFKAWHLTEKVVNVTLVSVNGASIPSDAASQINDIYKKAAVTFNISEDLNFNIDPSVWGDGDIEVGDSGLLSHYTNDEKEIYNAYKDQNGVEEEMFYVFITDTPSSNSANGFMKIKGKYGFIFKSHTDGTNIGKIIAHELGHGVFALEHPYKTYQGISKNSALPWLMEYNQATQLPQMDWTQIHNPKFKIYLFQDDEDGEDRMVRFVLTPDGKIFTSPSAHKYIRPPNDSGIPNGTIYGITKGEIDYKWDSGNYISESGEKLELEIKRPPKFPVLLYWYGNECSDDKRYRTSWSSSMNIKENFDITAGYISFDGNIPCPDSTQLIGTNRNDEKCQGIDLVIIEEQRRNIERILFAHADVTVTTSTLIAEINKTEYCALRLIDYAGIESALKRLIIMDRFDYKGEKAIVKLLSAIPEERADDLYDNVLAFNSSENLKQLLSKVNNYFYRYLWDDNKNSLIEILGYLTSHLKNDSNGIKRWNVVNEIIKQRYDKVNEVELTAFTQIFQSMGENESNIPEITQLFRKLLIRDAKNLNNYKIIFEIATIVYSKQEVFNLFTQYKTPPEADASFHLSWMSPNIYVTSRSDHTYVTPEELTQIYAWSKYLSENPTVSRLLNSDKTRFLETLKAEFLIFINEKNRENEEFWNAITDNNCDNIASVFNHIVEFENANSLKNVPETKRLYIIKKIFRCNGMYEGVTDVNIIENVLFKLLGSFDETNRSIISTIDDIGIDEIYRKLSGIRRTKFFAWVSSHIVTSGDVIGLKTEDLALQNNTNDVELKSINSLLKLEADIFKFQNLSVSDITKTTFKTKIGVLDYKQMVVVYVSGSFDFMGKRFNKGDVLTMPLLQAFSMSNNNRAAVFKKSAWLAIDVISLAVGVGSIQIAIKVGGTVRKLVVAADLLGSTSGALATALNEDAISEDTRFKFQMLSIIAASPTLAAALSKKVDNAITSLDNAIDAAATRPSRPLSSSGTTVLKTRLDKVTTILGDDTAFFSKLNLDNINIIKAKYDTLSDELKAIFKTDFIDASPKVLAQLNKADSPFFEGWKRFRIKYIKRPFCK